MMDCRLYRGPEALDEVKPAWDALEARSAAHPYQRYDFARLWYETIGMSQRVKPIVVVLECDGKAAGLFPACVLSWGATRLLTWMGGPDQIDYGDILFDPDAADVTAEEFVHESLRLIRPRARTAFTYFPNVRLDGVSYPGLSAELREFKRSSAPYVPLTGSLESLVAGLSRRNRKNLSRSLRQMEARGSYSLRWLDRASPEVTDSVARLIALKRTRFTRAGQKTNLFKPAYAQFLHACATHDPTFWVAELVCEDEVAAIGMGHVYRQRSYGTQMAFEERFAESSPGRVLMYLTLKHWFGSGIEAYELGWGDEPWKYEWTNLEVPLVTFVSPHVGGQALSVLVEARRQAVRLMARESRA